LGRRSASHACLFDRRNVVVCGDKILSLADTLCEERNKLAMAWLALLFAGLLEIGWALGLKYSHGFTRFWPAVTTLVAIILSFVLMGISLKSLPFGTAYAVWTGIGAAGTMIIGMIAFGEPTDLFRITCLALIIAGMIGLKLVS
jgi:quaternary ammonium compound-resistance protein SugE